MTLDFAMMKRSIRLLIAYEDEISSTMSKSVESLFKQISNELTSNKKGDLEDDAHFLNIFFIIFQLPYLSDPVFLYEHARIFYSLFTKFSLDLQVKFIRILAKHKDDLKTYVDHIQQYITMYTVKWTEHTQMNLMIERLLSHESGRKNRNEIIDLVFGFFVGMFEGLNILRLIFYGNLLAGERDTLENIETERDNDQKMDVELVNRRQRTNNDGDDDDDQPGEQESNEQQTRSDTRTSTNEQDEIESIYEHPLQIRLHLQPNEYRHGHLTFDYFINEYANEKIDISKEYLEFIRQRTGTTHFSFILYPFFLSTTNKIGKSFVFCFQLIHIVELFFQHY